MHLRRSGAVISDQEIKSKSKGDQQQPPMASNVPLEAINTITGGIALANDSEKPGQSSATTASATASLGDRKRTDPL